MQICSFAFLPCRFCPPQQQLEMRDMIEQRLAAALGQRVTRLRLAIDETLFHRDVAGVLELAQMHAGIAVGGLDSVAYHREVDRAGAREKRDDRDANPALQHLVDRIVVEVDHAAAGAVGAAEVGRPRHSNSPGNANSCNISTAESDSTSTRWRSA